MTDLLRFKWQKIASTRHAAQLLRREIKQIVKVAQQRGSLQQWRINRLLGIVPGATYQFVRISDRPWAMLILKKARLGDDVVSR